MKRHSRPGSQFLFLFFFLLSGLLSGSAYAVETSSPGVTFGGFVDTYYAYDFDHPPTHDRSFTTQPARDNEFNVNLAFIEAKVEREKVHGRLALQAGTSVQNNYAGEPTIGTVSGPSLSRNIQEAYAGYRLGEKTWIDAGVMLSHIGVESFISKDNLLYTRSLVADYSPYYETGVRLSSQLTERLSGQLLLLNGWQNISESNTQKALGTQLSYGFAPEFVMILNTFFGQESGFRQFNDLIAKWTPNALWTVELQADIGFQGASWGGFTLMAKRALTPVVSLNGRVEYYSDPSQVVVSTGTLSPFRSWGSALGVDVVLDKNAWWRNELRGYWAAEAVFPSNNGLTSTDGVIVSSISFAF